MQTLTSHYSAQELYELTKETVEWNGNEGVFSVTETDFFEVEENKLFLTRLKERESIHQVVSRKELEPHDLYLLFEMFENVVDAHLSEE